MSERLRLLTEYRTLWATAPTAWKDEYPVLYHLMQQEARHPLIHQGQVRTAPFLDELPWLTRLNRHLAGELPRLNNLTDAVRPLLQPVPGVLVEWGYLLPEVLLGFEAICVGPTAPQGEGRQWFEADLNSGEAFEPIRGQRQLLALGLGLEEAQQLLLKGTERRLPAMVLAIKDYHLINTSSYQPLQTDEMPDIPIGSLRMLSMTQEEAAKDWPSRLLRWLFRPALRQAIFEDLASFARLEGYQADIQPLPAVQGRQMHALVMVRKEA
ncbi:MAG: hypothetical protein VX447_10150 [Pseudomonadota bacterium]|uniref:Uncharacterized protein n=1 Tax=Gallaecimonas pentaromativorans TaxID=584787 RepID=A0A3N1P594_9GAMM|nr:hypothetical protein [Gallaecimonas pentaromativorans]MED5525101.1 hypothetical protein [Pseudomonadota bacterium]ROQ22641.1 hypothetical protein EDC28_109128 [Gallaecimonas pentaromativorans]